MIYDQVKPNTSGWNQVISEFERNVKIFLLLQESEDVSIVKMAKQNVKLMQEAFHNMRCVVDNIPCKCDDIILISPKIAKPKKERHQN